MFVYELNLFHTTKDVINVVINKYRYKKYIQRMTCHHVIIASTLIVSLNLICTIAT